MGEMFELNNVTFCLNDGQAFFKDLSLSFQAGKIHCISGDNGVGKSTFFRMIRGRIKRGERISGSFFVDKARYDCVNDTVPQSFSVCVKVLSQQVDSLLVGKMSVAENIRLSQIANQSFMQKFTPQFGLDPLLLNAGFDEDIIVDKLSGGQKQLLAFVMGYQSAGTIFLLDEPTAALDTINTHFLMEAISNLAQTKNLVIVMISHDYDIIKRYCTGHHYKIMKIKTDTRTFLGIE